MENGSIIKKIHALLNQTVENGATEAEAATALDLAQKLMTKHMVEESQLAEHAKDKKCTTVAIPKFKTGYDTDGLNWHIADAFDCENWWVESKGEIYFFGFGDDAKLAAYFYNYLNNAIVNDAEKYKKSFAFIEQKIMGHHSRTILASFRKGMMSRLVKRLDELKATRVSNVVKSTGTNLVVVKEDRVKEEYEALGMKIKTKRTNWDVGAQKAYTDGKAQADKINMAGGIQQAKAPERLS